MSGNTAFAETPQPSSSTVHSTPKSGHNLIVRTAFLTICSAMLSVTALAQTPSTYVQTNIISDGSVPAAVTDSTLINPWGVSVGPALWIDKAGSGSVAVDTAAGALVIPSVTIPAASETGQGSPSGTVYNGTGSGFNLPGSTSALFLFGTLDGTIAAWNATSGTQAVTVVNNSSAGASYTDIALDTNATGTFLLAADFNLGKVDVFNSSFAPATLAGSFADPGLPTGYAPFGIHSIGSMIYVTYAQVNPGHGEMVGSGLGYVDVFDVNGNLLTSKAISQGVLNAPWGMALAPAGFGSFGGDLLVGNFGDGVINAFNPTTFAFIGSLNTAAGNPVANPGLWEIFFGQGNTVGDPNTLYFAAGINSGKGGLFGSIAVAGPAAGSPNFTFSTTSTALTVMGGTAGNVNLSLAPTNGFSGPVTFSCTSSVITCTFTPSTVTLSGTTTTTIGLAVAETSPIVAPTPTPAPVGYQRSATGASIHLFHSPAGATLAFIGPIGLLTFAGLKRRSLRSALVRGSLLALLLAAAATAMTGCSSQSSAAMAAAPATPQVTQLTINATSGSITQSVTIAVTEQ
jgi:uncharacterized protein (TIGR03118 family)